IKGDVGIMSRSKNMRLSNFGNAKLQYLVEINDDISVFPPSMRLGCMSSGLKLRFNSFQSQSKHESQSLNIEAAS
ncbi:16257_t:CDS:2, partial [Funneliformis geosporum]